MHTTVDEELLESLRQFSRAAELATVPWLIVGATARCLLLESVYQWPKGRATEDTDFAVWVEDWAHFDRLCQACADTRHFEALARPPKRFRAVNGRYFDLLPYGGVEGPGNQVLWPPHGDSVMTVRGFRGAAKAAYRVTVNDELEVPVASPAGLLALKLFAWEERGHQQPGRDAEDIAYLIEHAERIANVDEIYDRYPDLAAFHDYDLHLAAISVLGWQAGEILASDDRTFLLDFLGHEIDQDGDSRLVADVHRYMRSPIQRIPTVLAALWEGLVRAEI
nr:nucleotidyl transferase AbiEii/AbiGii toxin family protein [Natronospira proteinivora]